MNYLYNEDNAKDAQADELRAQAEERGVDYREMEVHPAEGLCSC